VEVKRTPLTNPAPKLTCSQPNDYLKGTRIVASRESCVLSQTKEIREGLLGQVPARRQHRRRLKHKDKKENLSNRNPLQVVIRKDFLTALAAGHAVLLLLSELGRSQFLLFLVAVNLVAPVTKMLVERMDKEFGQTHIASNLSSSSSLSVKRGPDP
jgi:hypothetical protein